MDFRILLVQEYPDTERALATALSDHGSDVILECNPQSACAAERSPKGEQPPLDAIVMDLRVPVPDGSNATRQLRQNGFQGPIIIVSAYDRDYFREDCLESGCTEFLARPIDLDVLVEHIRHALSATENRQN